MAYALIIDLRKDANPNNFCDIDPKQLQLYGDEAKCNQVHHGPEFDGRQEARHKGSLHISHHLPWVSQSQH
eukprot:CAMPEP_0183299514 /NCGR_PEP_ID=MMETSP0160_2-20130417/6236_1 /TAXON_ID=2839 ORGANISM="Odontella Sinensis, Strain Grunow 1884" /NCGR_SAMPLE_ID=MMETSP0160_2 /ASSEMBLY_ACC=CAM_ASM_000250 /LENGTH=70 /DNA_ID=CAMNT_0025461773 /DNA_START=60 /DNA_END=269 /DNA_ORIENTATION=+